MANTTSRLALTQPVGTDPVSELRTSITGNATTLDDAAIYQEDMLANRPAASSVAHGTFFRATDTGDLSWSNGTAWASVCQLPASGVAQYSSGTFAARPAAGVGGRIYYATDNGLVYQDTGSAWLTLAPVGAVTPVGTIQHFAAATVPADPDGVTRWHVCDGSAISRTTYATLFSAISTSYGAGDGSTTFNIPDLRGRVPVGAGHGAGLTNRPLAAEGGEETHVLSVAELATHAHTLNDPTHAHSFFNYNLPVSDTPFPWIGTDINTPSGADVVAMIGAESTAYIHNITNTSPASTGVTAEDTGSGTAHNTMQPFLAVNHIIKIL